MGEMDIQDKQKRWQQDFDTDKDPIKARNPVRSLYIMIEFTETANRALLASQFEEKPCSSNS